MVSKGTAVGIGLVLAMVSAGMAAAATVVIPADRVRLATESVLVAGRAKEGKASVAWRVEGSEGVREGSVRVGATREFSFQVPLAPGLNRLSVERRVREVFRDAPGTTAPAGFAPQRQHAGDSSACGSCHDAAGKLRAGGYPGVCLNCHVIESRNPQVVAAPERDLHFKANIAKCGRCHDPHAAGDPKLRKGTAVALCGECHERHKDGVESHAAYDDKGCIACHDPHYSGYAMNLLAPAGEGCKACHDQGTGKGQGKPHALATGAAGCSACHDPHGKGDGLLKAAAASLCGTCHTQVAKAGHGTDLDACTDCHQAHGPLGKGLLRRGLAERCGECHDGVIDGKVVHQPAQTDCGACHNPHRAEDRKLARTGCVGCHDLAKNAELASLHGRVTIPAAGCVACHVPHASAKKGLLAGAAHFPVTQGKCSACHTASAGFKVASPEVHCRRCHSFEADLKAKGARLHDPVAEGECLACHGPHLGQPGGLLKGTQASVCGECHDQGSAGGGKSRHSAVSGCTDCHRPHGGKEAKFLTAKGEALCQECHDDPAAGKATVHAALDEGCLLCHDPHAGYGGAALRKPERDLCLECHDDHATGGKLGLADQACSVCHLPHASDGPDLLRGDRSAASGAPARRPQ